MKVLEILSKILDDLSNRRVLLWTNPNPTASFGPQTINLDLSDYDYVEIIAKKTASETWYFTSKIPIIAQGNLYFIESGVTFDRNCTLSSTGIQFKTGYYNLATGSLVTDNTRSVPYQIYGIKENI